MCMDMWKRNKENENLPIIPYIIIFSHYHNWTSIIYVSLNIFYHFLG